jgi:hypothetical protein
MGQTNNSFYSENDIDYCSNWPFSDLDKMCSEEKKPAEHLQVNHKPWACEETSAKYHGSHAHRLLILHDLTMACVFSLPVISYEQISLV